MLLRISLVIAILAGVGVGVLNFLKVKERIVTLQTNLKTETEAHQKYERDYRTTLSNLTKTNAILKQTEATLAATTEQLDSATKKLDTETKRADKLTEDLRKSNDELKDAQANLAAYVATGFKPPELVHIKEQIANLEASIAEMQTVNKANAKTIASLNNELDRYRDPNKPVYLPANLTGKVLIADPKWNFVVLNIGDDQGVREYGELLVNRDGKLVAKVIVRSMQKDRSIANVMPGWQLGEVMEGDQVIPAHPQPPS
jgi:hypothetical protein